MCVNGHFGMKVKHALCYTMGVLQMLCVCVCMPVFMLVNVIVCMFMLVCNANVKPHILPVYRIKLFQLNGIPVQLPYINHGMGCIIRVEAER